MRIAIYSAKGGSGKTPIAANIALDKDLCIGTNEVFHAYNGLIKENRLLSVDVEAEFPQAIKEQDIDIIFDLAGLISKTAISITSAISMSDILLIPIYNEYKSLIAGINTINQVMRFNENIIVIATKLQKQKSDINSDWRQSGDFLNIQEAILTSIEKEIHVMPLKFSKAFDNIFEKSKSIWQMSEEDPLAKYNYREVVHQFNAIYQLLGI